MKKEKLFRIIAAYLLISMVSQYVMPVAAFALTGGPSQPEVESFEPVGTTEMVDVFSGDFNYNIPLLTVPGPNGGYPINMAYHAGIGMEQEASWVGLGWNINVGEINRTLRGIPDDFNNAKITKQYQSKPNNTLSVGLSGALKKEYFGFSTGGVYGQLYYNNYKGVGYEVGMSLSSQESNASAGWNKTLSLSLSSEKGIGVNPGLSYGKQKGNHYYKFHAGVGYTTKDGVSNLSLKAEKYAIVKCQAALVSMTKHKFGTSPNNDRTISKDIVEGQSFIPKSGCGVTFASSGFVPNVSMPVHGMNMRFSLSVGKITTPQSYSSQTTALPNLNTISATVLPSYKLVPGLNYNASLSLQWTPKDPIPFDAYGYLNTQFASSDAMLDFNREKDVPPTKDIPALPVPVYTYDSYFIKGQGIGGVFRPYRNDVSVLSDPHMGYDIPTFSLSGELATSPNGNHWGLGLGIGVTNVQSGDWRAMDDEMSPYVGALETSIGSPLFEPVYFRAAGDQAENSSFTSTISTGDKPARYDLGFGFGGLSLQPKLKNKLVDKDGSSVSPGAPMMKLSREKRNQQIEYYTNAQIRSLGEYPIAGNKVYDINKFPFFNTTSGDYFYFDYNRGSEPEFINGAYDEQIGTISVLNPDGNRYYYALPAYNKSQKEVVFSTDNMINPNTHSATASYNSGENTADNKAGDDHLYSSIQTPAYAHSYLLTAIVSADYIDMTGDGPSDDDFGYWVKFNYSRIDNYNWRIPYGTNKGNFGGGNISDMRDDKLSYVYGSKEIYYLNSVETKTHMARFLLRSTNRDDARGVNDEDNSSPSTSSRQYALDKVELFSKKELAANPSTAKSIKTVNFEYDNSLCKQVENNLVSSGDDGKLTLKKVWFSYLGNTKGQLSPYTFDYHSSTSAENPNYSIANMDRWGNYQPENSLVGQFNAENSYVDQTVSDRPTIDQNAGAWNLKEITLPSGGKIAITYEADDYAFVQDKRAMEMVKCIATSDPAGPANNVSNILDKKHTRLVFTLDEPIQNTPDAAAKLHEYGNGIDKLYFKVFEKLKKYHIANNPSAYDNAYDYVEGYARVKKTAGIPEMGFIGSAPYTQAWIEVEPEKVTNSSAEFRETHPFRKAGWQYLKLQRPDLFGPRNDFGGAVFSLNPTTQAVQQMLNLLQSLSGYYNYCWMRGFCNTMVQTPVDDNNEYFRPSYIRLNSPDKIKVGGGHRVQKITLNDNWASMVNGITPGGNGNEDNSYYGQQFSYTMADGSSSGVAEYEPLAGGEEIPHHQPLPYSSDKFLNNDKTLFIEEPMGESFFPPANVGYRRVIVKNIDPLNVTMTKNKDGIKVNEFYTAKEFPIKVDKTEDVLQKKYWLALPIPFLGSMSFNNRGYSQGFSIELNDMHGKPRSVSTYSSNANLNDPSVQPVSKVEYNYKTKDPFSESNPNYLANDVTVLDGDGNYRVGEIGLTSEMYIDKSEHFSFNSYFGLDPNIDVTGLPPAPPIISITVAPQLEINESQYRAVTTVKIIQRTGVLIQTKGYDQGSMAVTDNLMFDSQTGMPLLTSVNNNFDKPVYSYKYAAHWAYDQMGSADKNWGAKFSLTVGTGGVADYGNASSYFTEGDELAILVSNLPTQRIWIKNITKHVYPVADNITLMDEQGAAIPNGTYSVQVIRSGRRNQQSSTNGTIVSLSNPVTNRTSPLFAKLDNFFSTSVQFESDNPGFKYFDCATNTQHYIILSIVTGTNSLQLERDQECTAQIQFPDDFIFTSFFQLLDYHFVKIGNKVKVYKTSPPNEIIADWVPLGASCFQECIPDVLHADATVLGDKWENFFYFDIGDADIKYKGSSTLYPISGLNAGNSNQYRTGQLGIWRTESTHLYQIDRAQTASHTNIGKDGTYPVFVPYEWGISSSNNTNWSLAARTTLYSPYGYALEERDTIGIYSSSIFGYDNSLSTAVAANARYFEIGFDGFEDYTSSYPQTVSSAPLGHGHLLFKTGASTYPVLSSSNAHTGVNSLRIAYNSPVSCTTTAVTNYNSLSSTLSMFTPMAGKEYLFSCWVKNPDNKYVGTTTVQIKDNASVVGSVTTSKTDVIIEGWHLVTLKIPALVTGHTLNVVVTNTDATSSHYVYLDDARIQPFTSAIMTYVYNPSTLWLIAELDNQNFATFYNYDEEGVLVQVKKETTSGIITIRSTRNNTNEH
ncbi:MAG: hypothetical protein ABIS12_09640 [Bacteroidia bacterium]